MSSRMQAFSGATFSDFLNPLEVATAIKAKEKDAVFFGGYDEAERVMMGFFDTEPDYTQFPISIVEITYNTRFSRNLTHRDFLGSILSLGLNRSKIGDILIDDGKAVVFVHKKILRYVTDNLETIANTKIKARELLSADFEPPVKNTKTSRINVSSLRLDAVVSAALNISRGKSASLINQEKVFINWLEAQSVSKIIKPGDVITVRGSGRIKILDISGQTKKGRILLQIEKNN